MHEDRHLHKDRPVPKTVHAARDENISFCLKGVPQKGLAHEIITAVYKQDTAELKRLLSDPKSFPDYKNISGLTPLMMAAARGYAQGVDLLCAHPLVVLDRQNENGWTALHFAAYFGEEECLRLLLHRQAARDVKNDADKTPQEMAQKDTCAAIFLEPEKTLRQHVFNTKSLPAKETQETEGDIIAKFIEAAKQGRLKACEQYLERLVRDFMALDIIPSMAKDGLRAAITGTGDPETVALLVQYGAEPNDLLVAGKKDAYTFLNPFTETSLKLDKTVFLEAFNRNNSDAVREMLLWGNKTPALHHLETLQDISTDMLRKKSWEDKDGHRAMISALAIPSIKKDMAGASCQTLQYSFKMAVSRKNMNLLSTVWVESRQNRTFRGTVKFENALAANAAVLALLNKHYSLAEDILATGVWVLAADKNLINRLVKNNDERAFELIERDEMTADFVRRIKKSQTKPPSPFS